MAVITINRDHLREVAVQLRAIEQQLNVVTALCDIAMMTARGLRSVLRNRHLPMYMMVSPILGEVTLWSARYRSGLMGLRGERRGFGAPLRGERRGIGARGIAAWHLGMEKENLMLKFYRLGVLFSVKS